MITRDSAALISSEMREHITRTLTDVERAYQVRVLYAAESGSRAWGFGSPDSDYDVRFIYAHPAHWYVSLFEPRDVIERALDGHLVDLAGWDLRKALRLLLKSNPALFEWFVSPVVYRDDGLFRDAAKALFAAHASVQTLSRHYWSIARGQWMREIDGRDQVKLKKYLYVVRPLLSLSAVIEHHQPPPMDIADLVAGADLSPSVRVAIDDLLRIKRDTPELGLGPRIEIIDAWAREALERFSPERLKLPSVPFDRDRSADAEHLFRSTIGLGDLNVL